ELEEAGRFEKACQERRSAIEGKAGEDPDGGEAQEGLRRVRPRPLPVAGDEVVERLGEPELADEQRRVGDEEELLVGAEARRIDQAHEGERKAKSDGGREDAREHERAGSPEQLRRDRTYPRDASRDPPPHALSLSGPGLNVRC